MTVMALELVLLVFCAGVLFGYIRGQARERRYQELRLERLRRLYADQFPEL